MNKHLIVPALLVMWVTLVAAVLMLNAPGHDLPACPGVGITVTHPCVVTPGTTPVWLDADGGH